MKIKNKFLLCIWLLILIIFTTSCGVTQDKKNIYDNNDKIADEGDSFSYFNRMDTEDSNDKIDIKYSGFYGTDTIWILESKEAGEITFKYNSTVDSGDFKAVLINPKKEIENILIGNKQGDKKIKLTKGKYAFKIVGRNAKGEVNISVNESKNIEITKVTSNH